MNRLGHTQRELYAEEDGKLPRGVRAQTATVYADDDMLVRMLSEVASAKRAWAVQLDIMMQAEERPEQREALRLIRLDDLQHIKLLNILAHGSLGEDSTPETPDGVIPYTRAAQLKLQSAEFVRRIYYNSADTPTRDILFEIISDDTHNAIRFTMLL